MQTVKYTKTQADLGLLSATVFWGSTFILSKILLEQMSLISYLATRLTFAAIVMILISVPYRDQLNIKLIRDGIILGIFLFFSYFFQMWGLKYTTATNAGFITGLHVVMVPIFSVLLFKDHPRIASLIGVCFATTGLFLLSGGDLSALNRGDWYVFFCAIAVTFHVILTGKFAPKHNIYLLTSVELTLIAVFSIILMLFNNYSFTFINLKISMLIIYLAIFGTVYTFLMQTSMQRFTTATRTALVFTMEPVFAALFAYIIAGETLQYTGWLGGLLILIGMFVAEIEWNKFFSKT